MLTQEQRLVFTAYTGVMFADFNEFHEYAQELLGRELWTHELGYPDTAEALRDASREDFLWLIRESEVI